MVSYGNIFEFAFDSQNGADFLIVVSKKDYSGEVTRRPLGRAPVLKRENNGHIYGTSLEIYAECTIEGEYAQFYTSDPFEYRVQLYKNGSLLWLGYISPELYSEPDIAPPYDVQIIATDSLGELKNYTFVSNGPNTLLNHLNNILGMSLSYQIISDLRYEKSSGAMSNSSSEVMNVRIDLGHEDGENCYDVLQRLLESFNMSITQYNERWLLFRETDFINMASSDSVIAYDLSGGQVLLDVARFGSMNECEWWPVGQMSTVIEPARKEVTVQSPNHYKDNALSASDWDMSNGAIYDSTAGAYILPDEGSNIVQRLDFQEEVGYRLVLNVSARNVGDGDEDQPLGVQVRIDGRGYRGEHQYWLIQQASSDRGVGAYVWKESEGAIEAELAVPSDSDTSADAQNIEIILPLYSVDPARFLYATSVEVTIFNPQGTHDIHVYGVQLSKYDQSEGYQSDVKIDNGAREEGDDITMSLTDGSTMPAAGRVFMTGVPIEYPDIVIKKWAAGADDPDILLTTISKDYARAVALPRMRYTGSLNVPKGMTIPVLFIRNNTFYFPKTYSYDLWNDEVEVDLISVPAAEVSIASSVISEIKDTQGSSSSGSGGNSGGGSGSGIGGAPNYWKLDENGVLVTDKDVLVKGDVASGAPGQSTVVGVTKIILNGKEYPASNGIIDLGTIQSGGITNITSQMVTDALGFTPLSSEGGELSGGLRINAGNFIIAQGKGDAVVNQLYPTATNTYALGTASRVWSDVYTQKINGYTPINTNNIGSYTAKSAYSLISSAGVEVVSHNSTYDYVNVRGIAIGYGGNTIEMVTSAKLYIQKNVTQDTILNMYGGNVGMGVDSPLSKLHIGGQINISNSNNKNYAFISQDDYTSNTSWMKLGTCYGYQTEKIALTIYNGMVKIGNAIPTCSLDVSGDSKISGNLVVSGDVASGGSGQGTSITITSAMVTNALGYTPYSSAGGTINGNIGLKGCLHISQPADYSYDQGIRINSSPSQAISALWLCTKNASGYDTGMWGITASATGNLRFRGGASSLADFMNISQSGNVGIGTTNPAYKLDVNGEVKILGLIIHHSNEINGFSDSAQTQHGNVHLNYRSTGNVTLAYGGGRVGIGTNAPSTSYKVEVTGIVRCTSVSQSSDIRYKDKIDDVILSLDTMADAPLFIFKWNNNPQDHAIYLGTSAQYWEGHRKEVVSGDSFKGMDYATLGVAMGISNARIIRELKAEIVELKEQLRQA